MDEVVIMRVGQLLRRAMVNFGEDQGRQRRRLRCGGGGVLSEDCILIGDAGTEWF